MAETQTKAFVPVCPFHIRSTDISNKEPKHLTLIPRITDQVEVDKETLIVRPVVETYDVQAEIQTYKNQCGLEYFKLLLAQGKAVKSDAYDDGEHGFDTSVIPETIHEAHNNAQAGADVLAELAKALGVKSGKAITSDDLLDLLSQQVKANEAAKAAAASTTTPTEDK